MINIKEDEKLSIINHSCAHLLAQAVKRLYPEALFWVGPVIDSGFYYDIDLGGVTITEEDLPELERVMKKLAKDGKRIYKEELSKSEALAKFSDDPYKIDLINELSDDEIISCYTQGDFTDLCSGPHIDTVKLLKHFKLLKVSGAYYKGDSNNKMLQRIYGVCFENAEDLNEHLNLLEEAKKRDHRKLGKELELFMISEYGAGFPIWLPKGMVLRKNLEDFWYEEHTRDNYQFIKTPIMLNKDLWEVSGHWSNYRENMYISNIDDKEYAIKPMNCPGGILVYKNKLHSYKDFPLRIAELGLVHRNEASGALSGLFRVRSFTQDDAHVYLTKEGIEDEVVSLINLFDRIYKKFDLSYYIELSTRPEKCIGEKEIWNLSEQALTNAAKKAGIDLIINEGDGAFYGPKLDFMIKDSIGRTWQCGTIQLDMNLPERFDMTYINNQGEKERSVMIHRAVYGSLERFIGILIEHYAGAFPTWLAPLQVKMIPVNNEYHLEYTKQLVNEFKAQDIRVELDNRDEKLGLKIREAQMAKVPYMLIIGDNELEKDNITYRKYGSKESISVSKEDFINLIKE